MDRLHHFTVEDAVLFCPVIESKHGDADGRAIQEPRPICPSHEDVAGLLYAVEYWAISHHTDGVGCEQASAQGVARFDLRAGFFEPEGHEVSAAGDAIFVKSAKVVGVGQVRLNIQLAAHLLVAEEGRVADDVFGCRPGGLVGLVVGVVAEDGVGVFDVGEGFEEGRVSLFDSVVVFPLEESDPDDDAGDLVGVEVDLDAEELAGVGNGIESEGEAVLDAEDAGPVPEVE